MLLTASPLVYEHGSLHLEFEHYTAACKKSFLARRMFTLIRSLPDSEVTGTRGLDSKGNV